MLELAPPLVIQRTLFGLVWLTALSFMILSQLLWPWWRSWLGRSLMLTDASLFAIVTLRILDKWFGYHVPEWMLTITLALMALAGVGRNLTLLREQWWKRREQTRNTPGSREVLDVEGHTL